MITSFQFARMLRGQLRGGVATTVDSPIDGPTRWPFYRVMGRLDTGVTIAPIEVRVWQDFRIVRRVPPAVWCRADFMRDDKEWHNSSASGMCWVLDDVWRDAMSWKGKSALRILEEGCDWLTNDVRCLINRHYVGAIERLRTWPTSWAAWGHSETGSAEYEREKRVAFPRGVML